MRYLYKDVVKTPSTLDEGVIYHNPEFQLASFLCACGCGHKVILLTPDSHQVSNNGGFATVTPSVGVCDAPCKSHYFITDGYVQMLPAFTEVRASSVMRIQIARHADVDAKPIPLFRRLANQIAKGGEAIVKITHFLLK